MRAAWTGGHFFVTAVSFRACRSPRQAPSLPLTMSRFILERRVARHVRRQLRQALRRLHRRVQIEPRCVEIYMVSFQQEIQLGGAADREFQRAGPRADEFGRCTRHLLWHEVKTLPGGQSRSVSSKSSTPWALRRKFILSCSSAEIVSATGHPFVVSCAGSTATQGAGWRHGARRPEDAAELIYHGKDNACCGRRPICES